MKKAVMATIIAVLTALSFGFAYYSKKNALSDIYDDIFFTRLAVETGQYTRKIEYGLKNGKSLDNFYNIEDILNGRRRNSLLIRTLETEPDTELHSSGKSFAVLEQRTGNRLFSLAEAGDFTRLAGTLNAPPATFYVNMTKYWEEIKSLFPNAYPKEYVQYVLESDDFVPNPAAVNPNVKIESIDKSRTDFILSIYKSEEFGHRNYIEKCIETNPGFIALMNGEPVCYVLIHI